MNEEGEAKQTSSQMGTFAKMLEKNSFEISIIEGQIATICAASSDPPWVLNVKRGIISHLQRSKNLFIESKTDEVCLFLGK